MRYLRNVMLLPIMMVAMHTMSQTAQPFFLQKNWYSKKMDDVFENLSKNKLLKVEEVWLDIEKKYEKEDREIAGNHNSVEELLFPLWQLSQSVLLNTKEGRMGLKKPLATDYDPWQAYSILKDIIAERQMVIHANTFFTEKELPFSVHDIKKNIEKNLVDTVRAIATEDSYNRLIEVLVDFPSINVLEEEREQIAFKSAIHTNSVDKCQSYINKYAGKNRQHEGLVMMRRDSLAFVQMDTTITDCQRYLNNYPESRYKKDVEKRLHRYEFHQLVHTSKACQEYLDKYPNSTFKKQVSELKVQFAFDEMKAIATIGAYHSFCVEYRRSDYALSHNLLHEAQQLLSQALVRHYVSKNTTLEDLREFIKQNDDQESYMKTLKIYYNNLLYLPTSAFMNGCANLTGRIITTHSQHGEDIQEIMVFNQQGLLNQHTHSKTGLSESFVYVFDNTHGYQLSKKINNKRGGTITYTTTYNNDGALAEIVGSDGSKIRYTFDGCQLNKITYLRGNITERTDYYNSKSLIEKSTRGGNTIVYEYNTMGDAICIKKIKGSAILSTSTYEYEYPDGMPWQCMSQYNDGNYLLTKKRNYETSQTTEQKKSLSESKEQLSDNNRKNTSLGNKVFDVVEVMPCFPGGDVALMKFLAENIKYPVVAEDNGIQGRVICTFTVERDGSITDVKILKSVDPSLDKEAVRVLRAMPRWKPGIQKGAPVRVKYTVPVTFRFKD